MFRSALDALDVLARLKDRDGNGISKLVFTILSAVAETERDRTRERIADVKRDQRTRGRFLGGTVPFGNRLGADGELIPQEGEQEAIREMRAMKEGGASLRAIAEALQARGHSISHVAVARVLRSLPGQDASGLKERDCGHEHAKRVRKAIDEYCRLQSIERCFDLGDPYWLGRVALAHRSSCSTRAFSFRAARLFNCSFDHHEKQCPVIISAKTSPPGSLIQCRDMVVSRCAMDGTKCVGDWAGCISRRQARGLPATSVG